MNKFYKSAFFLLLLINIFFVGKHFYFVYSHNKPIHQGPVKIPYSLNTESVYAIFKTSPNDIIFCGDSHMELYDVSEFFPDKRVKNRGISGDITVGVLQRLRQFTTGQPKQIFYQVGFNDLCKGYKIDSVVRNYKLIIDSTKIQSPKSEIFINSIFPNKQNNYNVQVKDSIVVLNKKLESLCRMENVKFINVYPFINQDGGLKEKYDCGDHTHMNGAGYVVWSSALKSYLK